MPLTRMKKVNVYNAVTITPSMKQGSSINPSTKKPSTKSRRGAPKKKAGLSAQEIKRRKSKKSALETVYKEEVKEMFLKWFKKEKAVAGHVMTKTDVLKNIIKNIDKKQDDVLEAAMNDLKTGGFLETQEDGFTLVLTEKGAKSL